MTTQQSTVPYSIILVLIITKIMASNLMKNFNYFYKKYGSEIDKNMPQIDNKDNSFLKTPIY